VSVVANEAPSSGALFATFLEAVPDALIAVDGRGSIVLVNTQAEALFGYRREESIDVGNGTAITILLPSTSPVTTSEEPRSVNRRRQGGETVLVVEDEDLVLDVATTLDA